MACDLFESNVTVGPAVCVHCTFVNVPVQPASTAPAALPTATLVSATIEKVPVPVHVGEGAMDGGTTGPGAGAGVVESPLPHAASTSAGTNEKNSRSNAAGFFIFRSREVTNNNNEGARMVNAAHALMLAAPGQRHQARQTAHVPTATTTASNAVATAYQMLVNRCSRRNIRTSLISCPSS